MEPQMAALRAAGCVEIYEETDTSDDPLSLPGLSGLLKTLRPGDVLVVQSQEVLASGQSSFSFFEGLLGGWSIALEVLSNTPVRERLN
jgi:hypothetical protein